MMHAVGLFTGQPKETSVFSFAPSFPPNQPESGNPTLSADLSQYRDQIYSIIPEPGSIALLSGIAVLGIIVLRHRKRSTPHPRS